MTKDIKVSERERKVLIEFAIHYENDANCIYMRHIVRQTNLNYSQVRRSVRSLFRKGLLDYVRGLFDEDGMIAGSAYCCTLEGHELVKDDELYKDHLGLE